MQKRMSFTTSDLDRLTAHVEATGLTAEDAVTWRQLIECGRELAEPREIAERAGFIAGRGPAAATTTVSEDQRAPYRRSSGDSTRATLGNMVPRR
jgi:hypothetical protein